MLETIKKEGQVKIKDLFLNPPNKEDELFDPTKIFDSRDSQILTDYFSSHKQKVIEHNVRELTTFKKMVIYAHIFDPKILRLDSTEQTALELIFSVFHNNEVFRDRLPNRNWELDLENFAAVKLLLSKNNEQLGLDGKMDDRYLDKMMELTIAPFHFQKISSCLVNYGILFPKKYPEIQKRLNKEFINSDRWEMQQSYIANLKEYSRNPYSEAIGRKLYLRLICPERLVELNRSQISIESFKSEVLDPKLSTRPVESYRSLAEAKLLFASDIQFGDEGVQAIYAGPKFVTVNSLPERRSF